MVSLSHWNASLELYSQSCIVDEPIMWMVMGGHYRSFDLQIKDVERVSKQSTPCMFLLLFVRAYRAEGTIGHGMKFTGPLERLTHSQLKRTMSSIPSAGGVITGPSNVIPRRWANLDTWIGGTLAMRVFGQQMNRIPLSSDVIIFTRPDVITMKPINAEGFGSMRFALYLSHSYTNSGSYLDPTELMWIVNERLWNDVMLGCDPHVSNRSLSMCSIKTCDNLAAPRKDKFLDIIAEAPEHFGGRNFYASHKLPMRITRMNRAQLVMNGRHSSEASTIYISHDVLPFYSRCATGHANLPLKKSMIWQRMEKTRINVSNMPENENKINRM